MSTKTLKTVITLKSGDRGSVVVVPESRDLFSVPISKAIAGCQVIASQEALFNQTMELVESLVKWTGERQERIQSAHVTFRSQPGLLFTVVQNRIERDEELVRDLTALDRTIACDERFAQLELEVLSMPPCGDEGLTAFISTSTGFALHHAEQGVTRGGGAGESEGTEVHAGAR